MRSRAAWLWLGAGAYLAATIALFPAATAYRWFASPEVRAVGLEGTIWRGRAALVSVAGLGASDVEWTMAFAPLLIGRVDATVQARQPDGFVSTNVVAGLRSIRFLDLRATTTLATLGRLVPLGDVEGLISAQLSELELRGGWPERAEGQVRIAGLKTPLLMPGGPSELIPLGDYLVTLEERDDGRLGGRFTDQGGPLEITGAFSLAPDRSYDISGLLLPRPDAPQEIVQALQFLTGPSDANGRRPFELTGSL